MSTQMNSPSRSCAMVSLSFPQFASLNLHAASGSGGQCRAGQPAAPLLQLVACVLAIVHGHGREEPFSHHDFCAVRQLLMEFRNDSAILAIPFASRLVNDDRHLPALAESLEKGSHGGHGASRSCCPRPPFDDGATMCCGGASRGLYYLRSRHLRSRPLRCIATVA